MAQPRANLNREAVAQGFGFGGLCRFLSNAGPVLDPTVASGV
jgi:hypothetical protein